MSARPTRRLFILHRYAGLVTAPLILFFAISGIWQVFRLQDDSKKTGYKAPAALKAASEFHKVEGLKKGSGATTAFKTTITVVAVALAFAACIGIILGFRTTRPLWIAYLLLSIGITLPLVMYLLALQGKA